MMQETDTSSLLSRFRQNPLGIIGFAVVIIVFIMAIMAFYISPDYSPNANRQIPEVALKEPGYKVSVLKVRKNRQIDTVSFLHRLLYGQTNFHTYHTVSDWFINNDSIYWHAMEQPIRTGEKRLYKKHLADVIFPLKHLERLEGDMISIYITDDRVIHKNIKELQELVQKGHITTLVFPLGSDKFGRCMLSRLIVGVRISLMVGIIAVSISLTVGLILGAVAGYFGGKVDDIIVFFINTFWSIPTLLMVFAIVLALGRSAANVYIAIGLTMWVDVSRIVRGQVMELKSISYVEAAKSMGFSHFRILRIHILPNIFGPLTVITAANFATAILVEAGLSYLGFGIQPPTPSWGNMLNENYGYAVSGKAFLAVIPAISIMLLVLAFNLLGNALRDAFDVKKF